MAEQDYKYYAFISYNSHDTAWGKRVQRKLEGYRMPAALCNERGWKRTPLKPVFFAPTDIQPGGLTEELQERLRAARNLVVICSPWSAQSQWVGREIEFFHQLGRTKQIHFFIVDGTPHSGDPETECFNPIIDTLGLPEILGANVNERVFRWPWLNRERAYVQLVSKLLGVEFDAIWQRHKRQLAQRVAAWTVGLLAVVVALLGVWMKNQPVDVTVSLTETTAHNDQLPPLKDAVVTMSLGNETKTGTIGTIDKCAVLPNIPHRYLGQTVRMTVNCRDFEPLDTALTLTTAVTLGVSRDPKVYGDVRFQLWDASKEMGVAGATISIAGMTVTTDEDGNASLFVPLERQRRVYHDITSTVALARDSIVMPCGDSERLLTK